MKTLPVTALLLLLTVMPAAAEEAARNILFIVDGSGSMWGQIEGEIKIAITQKALAQRIKNLRPM